MIESVPLTLSGDRVALGPLRQKLASLYSQWEQDVFLAVLRGADLRPGIDGAGSPRVFVASSEPESAFFTIYETIYDSKAPRPIGICALRNVDHAHRTSDFTIFLGERDTWGTGLGTEAARLTLDFAFHGLGLFNVGLRVRATDARAIVSFERAGFRVIGRRRSSARIGQGACDELLMDAIATDFAGPRAAVFVGDISR